jgi:hypothetical protein
VVPANNGDFLNGIASGQVAAAQESETGVVTNTALNQTASANPESSNTGTDGANTFADVVAGGGGTPIANVQGGSLVTSGAVQPVFGASSVTGKSTASNISGADTASAGVFPGNSKNFQSGMNLSLTLTNSGLANIGSILSARTLSRQAMLQANQELQLVTRQVHSAFAQMLCLEKELDAAELTADSAREALRFASMRMKAGVGNSLEGINARRDFNEALVAQVRTVAELNRTQAQLLHEMGVISVDTLIDGLPEKPASKRKQKLLEW